MTNHTQPIKRSIITDKQEAIDFIWEHADVDFYNTICSGGGYSSCYDFLKDFNIKFGDEETDYYLTDDPVILCLDPSLLDDEDVWAALTVTGKCKFNPKFLTKTYQTRGDNTLDIKIKDLFENNPATHGRDTYERMKAEAMGFCDFINALYRYNYSDALLEPLDILEKLIDHMDGYTSVITRMVKWISEFSHEYERDNKELLVKVIHSYKNGTLKEDFPEYITE